MQATTGFQGQRMRQKLSLKVMVRVTTSLARAQLLQTHPPCSPPTQLTSCLNLGRRVGPHIPS